MSIFTALVKRQPVIAVPTTHLSKHRGLVQQHKFIKMSDHSMKYILVTGGVISGVGKGVIASSFGTILKCCGIAVTSIKIDPYINIDAGTFSPYEHGNYYVYFLIFRLDL